MCGWEALPQVVISKTLFTFKVFVQLFCLPSSHPQTSLYFPRYSLRSHIRSSSTWIHLLQRGQEVVVGGYWKHAAAWGTTQEGRKATNDRSTTYTMLGIRNCVFSHVRGFINVMYLSSLKESLGSNSKKKKKKKKLNICLKDSLLWAVSVDSSRLSSLPPVTTIWLPSTHLQIIQYGCNSCVLFVSFKIIPPTNGEENSLWASWSST